MSKYQVSTVLWIVACLGLWFFVQQRWTWIALSTFIYFSLLIWGSIDIQFNFYLKSVNQLTSEKNEIALTFDDGPHPNTLAVLDVLDKYEAKATFFCIGAQIEKHPEILLEIYRRGHRIGNHTYSHKNFFPISTVAQMEQELRKTNELIQHVTGVSTDLFRPPFGVTNPRIAKAVKNVGMRSIGWNRRSFDTVADKESILRATADKARSCDIVLFHDPLPDMAHILVAFFERVKSTGVQYTSVY